MVMVDTDEAKVRLSTLLDRVAVGEDVVIGRGGKPVARLVGIGRPRGLRPPGSLAGHIRIADDFDAPLPDDLLDLFQGKGE